MTMAALALHGKENARMGQGYRLIDMHKNKNKDKNKDKNIAYCGCTSGRNQVRTPCIPRRDIIRCLLSVP